MSMKLVIAIVQNEDNQKLNNALVKEGFRSTRLATSGGFLRTGNTTVMIGVEESKLEEVLGIIESVCKARKQTVSAVAPFFLCAVFRQRQRANAGQGGQIDALHAQEYGKMSTAIRIQGNIRRTLLPCGVKGAKR